MPLFRKSPRAQNHRDMAKVKVMETMIYSLQQELHSYSNLLRLPLTHAECFVVQLCLKQITGNFTDVVIVAIKINIFDYYQHIIVCLLKRQIQLSIACSCSFQFSKGNYTSCTLCSYKKLLLLSRRALTGKNA